MKLSLNLDDYLSEFKSLTFSNDLLKAYYDKIEETDNTVVDEQGELYYYLIDDTENYYKELLRSRYPKAYDAITIVTQPTYPYGEMDESNNPLTKPMTWGDWYDIVTNSYMMKGSVQSIQYLCTYLGIDIKDINYDLANLKITISVSAETQYPDLCRNYLIALAYDLLLLAEEDITIDLIIINYDIDYKIIYQTQLFTTVNNTPDNEFIISINEQTDITDNNISSLDEFKKYLLEITGPNSDYEDLDRYTYYNDRIRVNIDGSINGVSDLAIDLYKPSFIYMANNTIDMTLPNILVSQTSLESANDHISSEVVDIDGEQTIKPIQPEPEYNPYTVGEIQEDNPNVNLINSNKPQPNSSFITTGGIDAEPNFNYNKP